MPLTAYFSWIFYAPGDYLGNKFTARQRRAIATWIAILFLLSIPLQYPYKNSVSLIWLLSEIALVVGQWGVISAETPVEDEDG